LTVRFVHGKSVYKIGVQLEKEKLGKKWICPTTGKKFYDLNKEPVISPYTGEQLEIINTENLEKEKTEEIILENDDKKTSEVSETDEVKDIDNVDNVDSDVEILDDNEEESITEIEDDNFSDESEDSDSNIDELEEFEIDEEIDDDLDDDEFLDNNDDNSVEDVIGSVKKNKEED